MTLHDITCPEGTDRERKKEGTEVMRNYGLVTASNGSKLCFMQYCLTENGYNLSTKAP